MVELSAKNSSYYCPRSGGSSAEAEREKGVFCEFNLLVDDSVAESLASGLKTKKRIIALGNCAKAFLGGSSSGYTMVIRSKI